MIGRPITFIGKVEMGTRRMDLIELMEICAALEYDVEKLVRELKSRVSPAVQDSEGSESGSLAPNPAV